MTGSSPARRRRARLRPAAVLVVVLAVSLVFFGKLFTVQVVEADTLVEQSKGRREVVRTVEGARGPITDASGVELAASVARYTVQASPRLAADAGTLDRDVPRIAEALQLREKTVRRALTRDPGSDYAVLAKAVPLERFEAVKRLEIPWLTYDVVPERVYPNGAVAGNLVGFVGAGGEAQAGVEYAQDSCLAGTDGEVVYERAADGTQIPGTATITTEAKQGGAVTLTIDRDLQWYAQQVLGARAEQVGASWGAVVVQEVRTGRLLAVADWPTVDPNDVDATASRDTASLGSRAFTAPFEPGSTMKTVTLAALLDAGLADPGTRVAAPYRYTTPAGADVTDSHFHPTQRLTATGVLVESSNTGTSMLGDAMADARRFEYLKAFGFGTATEVGFGAESGGDLGANAPQWDAQSKYATMFGQGLTTTAVQMASAYATIGNGGVRMPVVLVDRCTAADGTVVTAGADAGPDAGERVLSADAARDTVRMLENVATKGWLKAEVAIPGYRVGMKTGTAQRSDGRGGYAKGYLVSMAGLAPADDPRYVVYVVLNDPVRMNTSQATAPVFRQVMTRVLQQQGVVPSGSTSPDLPMGY